MFAKQVEQVKQKVSIPHIIAVATSFLLTVVTLAGALYTLDDRWAKAADVALIELRLEQKIQSDRLHDLQRRIWMLEDRYKSEDKMPREVKEEYRKLKQEYYLTKKKLDSLYRQNK